MQYDVTLRRASPTDRRHERLILHACLNTAAEVYNITAVSSHIYIQGLLPAPMLRIGNIPQCLNSCDYVEASWHKYTIRSCCERDQGNAKWCREKAMPSVSSQFLYLSHSNYRPTLIAFSSDVIRPMPMGKRSISKNFEFQKDTLRKNWEHASYGQV